MNKAERTKIEIKKKCDEINEIAENYLSYPEHRTLQNLLCDILNIFDDYIDFIKSTES